MSRLEIDVRTARRLALWCAGLLDPASSGLPRRATGRGTRARKAALAVIRRFGYLQLDSVSVAGARTHGIVLASRLEGFDTGFAECLLEPDQPLFEYWGHEASWLPIELYPAFAFRRRSYRVHPWWGNLLDEHAQLADGLLERIADEGALRSVDLGGQRGPGGWWGYGPAKKVLTALWSAGEVAIRQRSGFQRSFDLPERVIPDPHRHDLDPDESFERLLLLALDGHGWAQRKTLIATWRLSGEGARVDAALERLLGAGTIHRCDLLVGPGDRRPSGRAERLPGFVRGAHLEALDRLRGLRPRRARGVLLSPFDPVLWDRERVRLLFGFEQKIEIYTPAAKRRYGYYCLPILAGDQLVGRVDTKAHRAKRQSETGRLEVLSLHFERTRPTAADRQAARVALERYAEHVRLPIDRGRIRDPWH